MDQFLTFGCLLLLLCGVLGYFTRKRTRCFEYAALATIVGLVVFVWLAPSFLPVRENLEMAQTVIALVMLIYVACVGVVVGSFFGKRRGRESDQSQ